MSDINKQMILHDEDKNYNLHKDIEITGFVNCMLTKDYINLLYYDKIKVDNFSSEYDKHGLTSLFCTFIYLYNLVSLINGDYKKFSFKTLFCLDNDHKFHVFNILKLILFKPKTFKFKATRKNKVSTFEVTFSKYMSASGKILYRINSIRYE